jgi:hypothetical protein
MTRVEPDSMLEMTTSIQEPQEAPSAATIALDISSRKARVAGAPKALGSGARRP